ncbi:unnamed protein product [Closterium sp. Yama58-4]|nr:unnamed protein product [Closterium sp. Yama58-4]
MLREGTGSIVTVTTTITTSTTKSTTVSNSTTYGSDGPVISTGVTTTGAGGTTSTPSGGSASGGSTGNSGGTSSGGSASGNSTGSSGRTSSGGSASRGSTGSSGGTSSGGSASGNSTGSSGGTSSTTVIKGLTRYQASSDLNPYGDTSGKFIFDTNITLSTQRSLYTLTITGVPDSPAPVFSNVTYYTSAGQLVVEFACVPQATSTPGAYLCSGKQVLNLSDINTPGNRFKAVVDAGLFANPNGFYAAVNVNGAELRGEVITTISSLIGAARPSAARLSATLSAVSTRAPSAAPSAISTRAPSAPSAVSTRAPSAPSAVSTLAPSAPSAVSTRAPSAARPSAAIAAPTLGPTGGGGGDGAASAYNGAIRAVRGAVAHAGARGGARCGRRRYSHDAAAPVLQHAALAGGCGAEGK